VFVSRIAQYDLQELPSKLDLLLSGVSINIDGLIKEFDKFYCDKSLFGSFASLFISAYLRFFNTQAKRDQSQLNLVIHTYDKFIKHFSQGATHSTGFILLELVIKANLQYLSGFSASLEIALYIHEQITSLDSSKDQSDLIKTMLNAALVYNKANDKMEEQLRTFMTIRIMDGL